jgi:hypothetical protein
VWCSIGANVLRIADVANLKAQDAWIYKFRRCRNGFK